MSDLADEVTRRLEERDDVLSHRLDENKAALTVLTTSVNSLRSDISREWSNDLHDLKDYIKAFVTHDVHERDIKSLTELHNKDIDFLQKTHERAFIDLIKKNQEDLGLVNKEVDSIRTQISRVVWLVVSVVIVAVLGMVVHNVMTVSITGVPGVPALTH
jgi:hypothetical protein